MSRNLWSRLLAVAFVLALASPLCAKTIKKSIELVDPAVVEGHQLSAGNYQIIATDQEVTFKHDGKVLAQVPANWATAASKEENTETVTEGNKLEEIRFRGMTRYLKFS